MYNLIMAGAEGYWDTLRVDFPLDRVGEYTDDPLSQRFLPVSENVLWVLSKLPVLASYEVTTDAKDARVARIRNASISRDKVLLDLELDERVGPVPLSYLVENSSDFGIRNGFELHRTHWAVKDVDLYAVLASGGFCQPVMSVGRPVPIYSRKLILAASTMLQHLGHADLDAFLLELNLSHVAPRSEGSRQERANAIGGYSVDRAPEITATGRSLGYELLSRAMELDATWPGGPLTDVTERKRKEFWAELDRSGWLDQGKLVDEGDAVMTVDAGDVASPETAPAEAAPPQKSKTVPKGEMTTASEKQSRIFVVHGRDNEMKQSVARYIERLKLHAVILHERPNRGRTILQKFRDEASVADFAVILLSPDDVGGLHPSSLSSRARQNVILEMGFFLGALPENRVVALVRGKVETPSDFDGVVYVPFDDGGAWKALLAKELRDAGIRFDANDALG